MAEKRTNISKLTMHYGVIHHARQTGKISVFNPPQLDDRFLTIRAEDLPGSNVFDVWDSTYPILAHEEITYPGQPLAAVFGPDYESVAKISNSLDYTTLPNKDGMLFTSPEIPPELLEWGNLQEITEKPDLKEVKSHYEFKSRHSFRSEVLTCTVWQEGDMINVELPCQWPELVRNAVSHATGLPEAAIQVHQLDFYAPLDEYLFTPAVVAPLAAAACLKLCSPIQLRENVFSCSPRIEVTRSTYCNRDGKPMGENVEMVIDQGAYPILEKEMMVHAMIGLLPNYPVSAFRAKINVVTSDNPPSSFFGSLSYSDSLATSQLHETKIAKAFNSDMVSWQRAFQDDKRRFSDYLPSIELKEMTSQAIGLAKYASFPRKWSSYDIQNGDLSVISFSRGIGIAVAPGISGFSTSFCKNSNHQIKLTLTEKGNLSITSSLYTKGTISALWADILKKELNMLENAQIYFLDAEGTLDSGPDTLGLNLGQIPQQLIENCQTLLLSKDQRPVSLSMNPQDIYFPCEFENQGSAAIIVETRLDTLSNLPVVTKVTASFIFGRILDKQVLRSQLKSAISEALACAGAIFSTDPENPYTIDLSIKSNGSDYIYTLDSTLKGLTEAALLSSVSQAVGREITTLPISAEDIFRLRKKKNEESK
jgi:Aerobic-type carbon monoxide dehydrogenase, large subunit CoxL/CutL homologs